MTDDRKTGDGAAGDRPRGAGAQGQQGDIGDPDADAHRGSGGSERDARPPKPVHRPVPGVKHVPEPDAENIMPAENEPGTL